MHSSYLFIESTENKQHTKRKHNQWTIGSRFRNIYVVFVVMCSGSVCLLQLGTMHLFLGEAEPNFTEMKWTKLNIMYVYNSELKPFELIGFRI